MKHKCLCKFIMHALRAIKNLYYILKKRLDLNRPHTLFSLTVRLIGDKKIHTSAIQGLILAEPRSSFLIVVISLCFSQPDAISSYFIYCSPCDHLHDGFLIMRQEKASRGGLLLEFYIL